MFEKSVNTDYLNAEQRALYKKHKRYRNITDVSVCIIMVFLFIGICMYAISNFVDVSFKMGYFILLGGIIIAFITVAICGDKYDLDISRGIFFRKKQPSITDNTYTYSVHYPTQLDTYKSRTEPPKQQTPSEQELSPAEKLIGFYMLDKLFGGGLFGKK